MDQQLINYKASSTMKARVCLGLTKLSVPEKIERGHHVVESMNSEPIFKNCIPPLAEVTALLAELETAYRNSLGGGHEQTALLHEKADAVDIALSQLANFVEIVAKGKEAVILSAGMETRSKAARPQVQFSVTHGKKEGEAVLKTPAMRNGAYVWQKRADQAGTGAAAEVWEQVAITTLASLTLSGLTAGAKYQFRVAYVTAKGQGPWSDPVNLIAL
jgi:hypothetical protein